MSSTAAAGVLESGTVVESAWDGEGDEDRGEAFSPGGSPLPLSVNYHLWAACNMRCRFCFAPFQDVVSTVLPKGHLPKEDSIRLVRLLARRFAKVTFVGGEPTLCPWLPELVRAAKDEGAITMLVTNGSRLPEALEGYAGWLDWVTLSIDSASPSTLVELGRAVQGRRALPVERYMTIADEVRRLGMRLKLNTVVTSVNRHEDMSGFVRALGPERWKVFRVLPVEGQNDGKVEPLLVSTADFDAFVRRHRHLEESGIVVVPEDNDDMRGSYAMIDPAGRFFDNVTGGYRYSAPILDVGIDGAWRQTCFSMDRFLQRGGSYEFGAPSRHV